jgi:hypothetical protein
LIVNSGPKIAENQRFEIAPTATPLRRSHGGKQRLDGRLCQGRQPPEAGAKGPPLQGLPCSQTWATELDGRRLPSCPSTMRLGNFKPLVLVGIPTAANTRRRAANFCGGGR